MTAEHTGTSAPATLENRLRAVARVLLAERADIETTDPGTLLDLLVRDVQAEFRADHMWLLSAAVSTILPSADDVRRGLRALELRPADEAAIWLLDDWASNARAEGTPTQPMEIVSGRVLVDVDFTARHDLHTGIQRVVRSVLPRWIRDHDLLPVVWTPQFRAYRTLTPTEMQRLLHWDEWHRAHRDGPPPPPDDAAWSLVLPWQSTVVLAEVPPREASASLAGMAQMSGNTIVGIGYDCIPIVNAALLPAAEPDRFLDYLTIVKHMRRIAGISVSAADEFVGFADMLATQGLVGPRVVECLLPSPARHEERAPATTSEGPLVISVGSYEPRKNQLATLHAAETLWREGLRFRLTFVGGGGWGSEFPEAVHGLARKGRPVLVARAISDDQLNALYAEARFSVFASLHEGYGLPVAESLAHGTPVITSEYGSTGEIAADGGALLIDPRDDLALIDAMRDLLTDESHLAKLHDAINTRPARDWDDYARELWDILVSGELVSSP